MKNSTQNRKKKYLALFLSAMMALSVASLAACKKGGNDSSESSSEETTEETTVTDKGLIKNAGFETFSTNKGLNVIGTSVSGWSKPLFYSDGTNSAPSSYADSGIINTADTEGERAWYNMTGSYYVNNGDAATLEAADELINALSEADAISLWDNFTVRDKLTYYEAWEDANEDGKIEEDFEKYENFNVDLIDIPDTKNPGTHHSADETAAEGFSDYNVLMIRNKNPKSDDGDKIIKSIGSAQYYKSSSTVTVPAGGAAEISVWVKTQDLTCSSSNGEIQEAVDKGAYISLAQTVGGTSLPVYEVKNINTEYMGSQVKDTNGWKQYTFYVNGSSYASTTLTLTLGLGQGTSQNRFELVNGYAFFDDITCNVFSQEDFYKTADNANGKLDLTLDNVAEPADFAAPKALKTIDVSKEYNANAYANAETIGYVAGDTFDVFPIDFYGEFTDADNVLSGINAYATKSEDGKTSMAGNNTMPTLEGGRDGSADTIAVFDNLSAIKNYSGDANKKQFIDRICEKYLQDVEYPGDNNKVLLMLSARGVAYTAESQSLSFSDDVEYMAVSFFVRTSNMSGFTGAGVTLIDGNNKTSISNIDTTNVSPVNIGVEGTDDYREDVYEGWQRCIFFVKNDSDNPTASFTLQFNFGPTTINESSSIDSFQPGFAAFTNFQVLEMDEKEYDSATADTYMKLVTISGDEEVTAAGNSGFDTAGNNSAYHTDIKNGIALAQNYKGVYSNSDYVTGNFTPNGNGTASNTYVNAGLLNRTYFTGANGEESYYTTALDAPAWMKGVTAIAKTKNPSVDEGDAAAVWSAAFGDATQPLFIWNDGSDTTNAYGFIGSSTTIAAKNTTAISLRVKVGSTNPYAAAPTAHIYLIDTGDDARTNTYLSIGANLTYWYDKNGDVFTGDPSERSSEKAFLLQDNGLYIANSGWTGYKAEMAGKYYANLNAYTEDANHNKLVSAQGGIHSYVTAADYVKVNGEKRAVAFYCQDGTYYADKAHKVPVTDFSESGLAPRTGVTESKALHAEVSATDDWVTVTFYVKTGAAAKNYRLEVWSGERTGNPNAADTYVMFDANPAVSNNAEKYYDYTLKEYEGDENVEQYKSVFSYFDTDNFLRYNKELDEDKVGNLYKDNYDPTAQKETTFYLYVGDTDKNQIFLVNYGAQDQVVTASEADNDNGTSSDDHDHDDETESGMDPLLLASSIAIAVVLLFAIASILFRKIWKKARKNAAGKKRTSKKSKKQITMVETVEEPKEEIDEDSPYND